MSYPILLGKRSRRVVTAPCLAATLWAGTAACLAAALWLGTVPADALAREMPTGTLAREALAAPLVRRLGTVPADALAREMPTGTLAREVLAAPLVRRLSTVPLVQKLPTAPPPQEVPDTLSGLVFDQGTGFPVEGVTVELVEFDGGRRASWTLSDGGGHFALSVPEGHYWLLASQAGYASSAPREVLWDQDSESVTGVLLSIQDLDAETVSIRAEEEGREGPARLLGRVVDHESLRPILDVEIELAVSGLRTLTDRNGMFAFPEVPSGQEVVHLRHLAYGEELRVVDLVAGTAYRLDGRLSPDPIELEGIEVKATSAKWFRRMDELRFRMERGISSNFILADELAVRGYPPLADALKEVPGLRVQGNGISRRVLVSRCGDGEPVVYLDGIKVHRPGSGPMFVLSEVVSMDVEAIEVYKGPASIPAQFIDSDTQCGVILIWTKRGG